MNRTLVLSTKSEEDLAEAVDWYNRIRPGLGDGLLLCVEQANDRILNYPEAFPVILLGVRRALVRRYPYGVFFRVRSKRVEVEAIFHLRIDPDRLSDRFGEMPV